MKNKKSKKCHISIIYIIILLFASCRNPVVSELIEDPAGEEAETITEDTGTVTPEIKLTLYSLQGVQRVETLEPVELDRYVIDTTEYIQMLIEVDCNDSFLFMNNNMYDFFGIGLQEMITEEYNIVIEIVGLFPELEIKELQEEYN